MKLSHMLRKIAYSPLVVKVFRFFHLRNSMRRLYYFLAKPRESIKKIKFDGVETKFFVKNPLDLRLIETPFESGMGDERRLIRTIITSLASGDYAFDVGASIGIHTVFMAKRVAGGGKVFAFEPEKTSCAELLENIKLNNLVNVETFHFALGNDFSEAVIASEGGTADFSLLTQKKRELGTIVKIVPGDHIVKTEGLPIPKLVKIDVEGYEYYVMKGLKATLEHPKCRVICCEIHPTLLPEGISEDKLVGLLKSYGFNRYEKQLRSKSIHGFFFKN